ncbi:MAG: RNA 3'-terminal phosphate cyclase [Thermoproteus sp. AZ2]|uniref:RNA 3'-terminal phosphate cyclase n=1 Tax=Thermoproteus sp. AZ2 TaxID=1609232 RepID=A0ACC6V1D5_9CREN|nr:MAG: ribosomal subunit interface protein [Thermoproteus sp. AZ2]
MELVRIDGSLGEGGGQILRSALALSAISGRPLEIFNIRAKRRNPGLQHQHLTSVKAAAAVANAEMEGAELGSTRLLFRPRGIKCGEFSFDVGTAGSITLVLQTLLPMLVFAPCPSRVKIRGGTDVPMAPPVDYFTNVVLKALEPMGVRAELRLIRRGHYPRGGGLVELSTAPSDELAAVRWLERGRLLRVAGISHAVNLPRHVAERQAKAAEEALRGLGTPINIEVEHREDGLGPGSAIVLWAETDRGMRIGADALGERGKPAEAVGREAAEKLSAELATGAALDSHMGDMIVLYMALARGRSEVVASRLTSHLETNIFVVEQFLPVKFSYSGKEPVKIAVDGVGFKRGAML